MRAPFCNEEYRFQDEVYQIVDAVKDNDDLQSQKDDVADVLTPKPKTKGTRLDSNTTIRKRDGSIPMPEPSSALPSLTESLFRDFSVDSADSDTALDAAESENDDDYLEAPSMTLREILVRAADTSQFDLLDNDDIEIADESFGWN